MLFAQNEIGGLIGYIVAGFVAMGGAIVFMFRLVKQQDKEARDELKSENEELKLKIKSLESIADEGHDTLLQVANWYRQHYEGKAEIVPVVKVVPEAHSPPTEMQILDASIATHRARLAEVRLAVGLPPRVVPGINPEAEPSPPKSDGNKSITDVLNLKEDIAKVPDKVVEKLKEEEPPLPMH